MSSFGQSSFLHMNSLFLLMIGITGAAIVGTGQFMHARSLSSGLKNCIAGGNKKASCEAKYKSPYGKLGAITLYGGCIFIVAAWVILGLVKSNLFSGMRPGGMMMGGMGMGGGMMGQQYYS
jgi:uncharacterized membrane protein